MAKKFQITILGSSAATPTSMRHTTAQLLHYHNKRFLLDCAEGTQMQLRRFRVPIMAIDHVFITHLHGDHYLGLAGLLFTLHLLGRNKDLHIYSPSGLKEISELQFRTSNLIPSYQTIFHEIRRGGETIYEDDHLLAETIEMQHRLPCFGYLFREKPSQRNILKEAIDRYGIPVSAIPDIKRGGDFVTKAGEIIPNATITKPPHKPRSYAFCSDTSYTERFLDQIKGVDLLYHEATFLRDKADIAREKTHSTTVEAATLASKAGAGKLLLGHYSARYKDLGLFIKEAREIFPDTFLAEEGNVVEV